MAGESSAAAKVIVPMRGLIGRKVGMTRVFDKTSGKEIPVSVIQTGTNVVHQVRTKEKDGYSAVQLGFEAVSDKKLTKPLAGHFKKLGSTPTRILKEFKLDSADEQLADRQRAAHSDAHQRDPLRRVRSPCLACNWNQGPLLRLW